MRTYQPSALERETAVKYFGKVTDEDYTLLRALAPHIRARLLNRRYEVTDEVVYSEIRFALDRIHHDMPVLRRLIQ